MKKNLRILALGAALISGISITHDAFAMEQNNGARVPQPNVLEKLSPDVFTNNILSGHFDKQELLKLRRVNKNFKNMIDENYDNAHTIISYAPEKQLRFKNLLAIARRGILRNINTLDLSMPIATELMALETDVECKDYIIHKLQSQMPYFLLQTFPNAHEVTALPNNMLALLHDDFNVTIWQPNQNNQYQQIQNLNLTNVHEVTALPNNMLELLHDNFNVTIWQPNQNNQYQQIQTRSAIFREAIPQPNNMLAIHSLNNVTIWRQIPTEELSPLKAALVIKLLDLKKSRQTTTLHDNWRHIFETLPQYAKNDLQVTVEDRSKESSSTKIL